MSRALTCNPISFIIYKHTHTHTENEIRLCVYRHALSAFYTLRDRFPIPLCIHNITRELFAWKTTTRNALLFRYKKKKKKKEKKKKLRNSFFKTKRRIEIVQVHRRHRRRCHALQRRECELEEFENNLDFVLRLLHGVLLPLNQQIEVV